MTDRAVIETDDGAHGPFQDNLRRYYEHDYLRYHPDLDQSDVDQKFAWFRDFLPTVTPNNGRRLSVVEIGCGSGRLLHLMSDAFGGNGIGVDLSRNVLQFAHQANPSQSYVQAEAEELPIDVQSADLLYFADLLEHLPKPGRLLGVLRNAPQILVLIPLEAGVLSNAVYFYRRLFRKPTNRETCGHLHRWTLRSCLRLFRLNGVNVQRHSVYRPTPTRFLTFRGRMYSALSRWFCDTVPALHRPLFGGYTLVALCGSGEVGAGKRECPDA